MKKLLIILVLFCCIASTASAQSRGNEFKKREAKIAQYKSWLDTLGPRGSQYWLRLDSTRRPHKLYLGAAFHHADAASQEKFIDTYSNYLAGHEAKFLLIDLYDADTDKLIGEYGFGGFKLHNQKPSSADDTGKVN